MPEALSPGLRPFWSAVSGPLTPNAFGMEGPVTSASIMPTRFPALRNSEASRQVTEVFPTPPLPDTTPMTLPIWETELGESF